MWMHTVFSTCCLPLTHRKSYSREVSNGLFLRRSGCLIAHRPSMTWTDLLLGIYKQTYADRHAHTHTHGATPSLILVSSFLLILTPYLDNQIVSPVSVEHTQTDTNTYAAHTPSLFYHSVMAAPHILSFHLRRMRGQTHCTLSPLPPTWSYTNMQHANAFKRGSA